jgi:hypothetical protein
MVKKGFLISPIEEKRRVKIRNVDITKLLSNYSEYERCKLIERRK